MKYKVKVKDGKVDEITDVGESAIDKNNPPDYLRGFVQMGEVICVGGQIWNQMNSQEKSELLELVEQHGQNPMDYIHYMESMYPNNPRGK